jgi:hypothetical protein
LADPSDQDARAFAVEFGLPEGALTGVQLTPPELRVIIDPIRARPPCFLLVFGCGNDSPLWQSVNRDGTTVFLEDDAEWAAAVSTRVTAPVHLVRYRTRRRFWRWWLRFPLKLWLGMALPPEIRSRRWDVILVDGPAGWKRGHPGRMQSIYEAARLVAAGGTVFVHDCERRQEAAAAALFLGEHRAFVEVQGTFGRLKGYAFGETPAKA